MAGEETILQHWILTRFAYPFLLIFFIVFALLEKTKILGDDKKQLNAMVAFVIGLIFVSVVYPSLVVENLILFLTVALVVLFIGLLLWGFAVGGDAKITSKGVKIAMAIVIVLAVVVALLWAMGIEGSTFDFLFRQSWSSSFWTNAIFVIAIAVALAIALGAKGKTT